MQFGRLLKGQAAERTRSAERDECSMFMELCVQHNLCHFVYLQKMSAPGLDVRDGSFHVVPGALYTEKVKGFRYFLRYRKQALQVLATDFTHESFKSVPDVGHYIWCVEETAHEACLKEHGALQSMPLHPVYLLEAKGAFCVSDKKMFVLFAFCSDLLGYAVPFLGMHSDKVAFDRAFMQQC